MRAHRRRELDQVEGVVELSVKARAESPYPGLAAVPSASSLRRKKLSVEAGAAAARRLAAGTAGSSPLDSSNEPQLLASTRLVEHPYQPPTTTTPTP